MLLATRKDGTMRFCVYFRRVKAATIQDTYRLPRMEDFVDSLEETKVFSNIEAFSEYFQVPIVEGDRDKTTFTRNMVTYRFSYMPFGLRNAPATFQRAFAIILSVVRLSMCSVYIDDEIVFSKK